MSMPDLEELIATARLETTKGNLPSYIPLLANVDPQAIAIAISSPSHAMQIAGAHHLTFPLMSAVKPFLLLYLLELLGSDRLLQLVDRQASPLPFNTIPIGKPPNPMLNCGAIALCSLLDRAQDLQAWLNQQSGANLSIDQAMLDSVRSVSHRRNLEITAQLHKSGIIDHPDHALAVYEEICCLRGDVKDLAKIGSLLIASQVPNIATVLEIMIDCGMYETSAAFAQEMGLPAKSSISGAILAIAPQRMAIACYSPALDPVGHSVAGMYLLRQVLKV
jgi:glutaminase